jgi:hypothetical protein
MTCKHNNHGHFFLWLAIVVVVVVCFWLDSDINELKLDNMHLQNQVSDLQDKVRHLEH